MTTKNKREDVVVLKNVRLSFPHLFEARASIEDGPKKFRAAFLMDPETKSGQANIAKINKAIDTAVLGVWKTKEKADRIRKRLDSDRSGLQQGDDRANKEGEVYPGYEGQMVISATNGRKPKVLRRDKSHIDSTEAAEIYAGCYVNAVISIWATNLKKHGGNGIFATLEIVQFSKHGEPFGAGELDEDDYLEDLGDLDDEDEDDMI